MLVAKVFKGWKQLWLDANTDLQKLSRALRKLMRFHLTKSWLKWREVTSAPLPHFPHVARPASCLLRRNNMHLCQRVCFISLVRPCPLFFASAEQRGLGSWMVNKIRAVNRAGRRRRSFYAWREVTASTHRILVNEKNKLAIRMEVIEQCKANAIRLWMNRQRLKALRLAWDGFDIGREQRERKRRRLRKFIMRGLQGTYARCFDRWKELHAELVRVRFVMVKILKSKMARAFNKWFGDVVGPRRRRRLMLARVIGKALHARQARAWEKWRQCVMEARRATNRPAPSLETQSLACPSRAARTLVPRNASEYGHEQSSAV